MALAIAAPLAVALLLALLALARSGSGRLLRDRARAAGDRRAAGPSAALPSIRMTGRERSPLVGRLLRFLRFNPDIPAEQVFPWPVVALFGAAVGAFAAYRLSAWVGVPLGLAAGTLSGVLAARQVFTWQHNRYCEALFRQIPDALGLVVRAIRAGLPLNEALRGVAREMPAPTSAEFLRVSGDIAVGRGVDLALARLHERTGLTEYAFLAVTLGLQAQTGGSLAETLENLADIVRKRVAMANRAKALAAEARMQAGLLVILPFVAALAMSFLQPFYLETFTTNPTGQSMAMVGLVLMLFGLLTIRWLIRQAGRD
jgi:tight adherence protein B